MTPKKPFWQSSTLWLNVLAVVIFGLQQVQVTQLPLSPDQQALIIAVLNFLNRLRTNTAISLK